MCTLTYVPNQQNFTLTNNRDEQNTRPTSALPKWHLYKEQKLFFSRDPEAGGTWLGHHPNGRIVCLLNGAFTLHKRELPYRMSRGLVVLEALCADNATDFAAQFSFEGIEAFTLIWVESFSETKLWELRWDQKKAYFKALDPKVPAIWSSATLYDETVKQKRESWFSDWLEAERTIRDFHYEAGQDGNPAEAVCMNRKGGGTVSISAYQKQGETLNYFHHNLRNEEKTELQF
ncbi:MAG: NRDE family protein [Bacteroidota bacterium]